MKRHLMTGCLLMLVIFCALPANSLAAEKGTISKIEDLNGKRAGVMTGTPQDQIISAKVEDVQFSYFNSMTDLILALKENKIDFFTNTEVSFMLMQKEYPDITTLEEEIKSFDVGTIFAKNAQGEALKKEYDAYINEIKEDGTLEELKSYWISVDDKEAVEIPDKGDKGTIHMATSATMIPFSYYINDDYAGFDVAIVAEFCRRNGYALDIDNLEFSGAIAGVQAGKYDLGAGQISYTEERAENVLYSEFYFTQKMKLIVRKADTETSQDNIPAAEKETITKIEDLNGKRAGVMTGTPQDQIISAKVEDVQFSYFNSMTDLILALKENKIDFFTNTQVSFMMMQEQYPDITTLEEEIKSFDVGTIFAKNAQGEALKKEYDAYIKEIKEDGTLQELEDYWISVGDKEAVEIPDKGEKGTIHMATSATMIPFSYYINDDYAGFDVAIVAEFCRRNGYALDIDNLEFSGAIAGVQAGKYDLGAGQISYTEERAENVLYSEFYFKQGMKLIVRKADTEANQDNILAGIGRSFRKTFLVENRWKMILRGLWNTIALTVLAAIIGSILGFFLYLMGSSEHGILKTFASIYIRIMQGTPMVVLLMIMYYIVFGKSGIDAFSVAVVAFAMNFAAYASEILRSGIESISAGQWEAASALGFTKKQAFTTFIFPQALRRVLPVYKGQLISLLKGTAIVGYIAIEDLTKIGDIIRSRTFEAFFPLIATAILYFLMAWVISLLIDRIDLSMDPKVRRDRRRGVK